MEIELYTILENDNWNIRCEFSKEIPDAVIIHCNVYEWSHTLCKEYLDTWEIVVEDLKSRGIKHIGTLAKVHETKLMKFACMFGFNIVDEVIVNGFDCIFMVRDIT